jgi:uncharacterized protein (TIGR02996 family)
MDDEVFLQAIAENGDDLATRLAYADWLQEQDDPRAEYVRAQARGWGLAHDDPDFLPRQIALVRMRSRFPGRWLALLDPPVWTVTGNIVTTPRNRPDGQPGTGTRQFSAGTRVFLASAQRAFAIASNPPLPREYIDVIGQRRQSRRWVRCRVAANATTNWRIKQLHRPGAMEKLREGNWLGFYLGPHEFTPPQERATGEAIAALVTAMSRAWYRFYDATRSADG